ncbi:hypothetical protein A2U01_0088083, partial [Trifolium medium]|nr:hypothetical protein [Trifolium medium]
WRRFQRQKKQQGQKVQAGGKVLPVETVEGRSAVVKQTGGNVVAINQGEADMPVENIEEVLKRPINERLSLFPTTPPADNGEDE